ncbi:hypothetical protein VPH35_127511 [Triticum aestivum]
MAPCRLLLLTVAASLGAASAAAFADYTPYVPASVCSTDSNYTDGSTYEINLDALLHDYKPPLKGCAGSQNLLSYNDLRDGAIGNGGFFQTVEGDVWPDKIRGQAMCYVDCEWPTCKLCLQVAPSYVMTKGCPNNKRGAIMYDCCYQRYSNWEFFGHADLSEFVFNVDSGSYVDGVVPLNQTRWELVTGLMAEAAGSPRRFANGSQIYKDSRGNSQVMYGLVQCAQSLPPSECTYCLATTLASMHGNTTTARYRSYGCSITHKPDPIDIATPLQSAGDPRRPNRRLIVAVCAASGSVFLLICISISVRLLCRLERRTHSPRVSNKDDAAMEDKFRQGTGPRRFRYCELAAATDNFSEAKKLGEGGIGPVYRGFLKGMRIEQGRKEYASEVSVISRLRHRNLVQIIGWCHTGGELLLVYELMPNGSLDLHLYSADNVLWWPVRHRIVLGIGSALLYLHQDWEQCVLHRDIKTSNVMLDASFNAKLGDFGLARLVDHDRGSHTTELAGTLGYMGPECTVTGRASTESRADGTLTHLAQRVSELHGQGRILDAADPRLDGNFDLQEMERVLVVGLWCACHDQGLRPSIRQAVNVLRLEAPLPERMPPVGQAAGPLLMPDSDSTGHSSSSTQQLI